MVTMVPEALDFISTGSTGSTVPVASTVSAMSWRATGWVVTSRPASGCLPRASHAAPPAMIATAISASTVFVIER